MWPDIYVIRFRVENDFISILLYFEDFNFFPYAHLAEGSGKKTNSLPVERKHLKYAPV